MQQPHDRPAPQPQAPELLRAREPSATGLGAANAAALCYVGGLFPLGGVISGAAFLLLEKRSRFVRFHAMQSILCFGAIFVVEAVLGVIPLFGWLLSGLVWLVRVVLCLHLMYRAHQGQYYKLPYAGDRAEEYAGRS